MLLDLGSIDDKPSYETDILIIGAGPAGIAIAREFLGMQVRVCLVESGDVDFSPETQALAAGENVGLPYFDLDRCRYRRFGGSMNGWPTSVQHRATSIAPMSSHDLEARPWVPLSGWPLAFTDLIPTYTRAQDLFAAGPFDYDPRSWQLDRHPFQPFDPGELTNSIWQYSPGMHFGRRFGPELKAADNIVVLTNANAVEILTDAAAQRVHGIRVVTLGGKHAMLTARVIVLACGAIENARLLLASNAVVPVGLGNGRDLVGRFFMEHPHLPSASVRFNGSRAWLRAYKDYAVRGRPIRAGICLSAEAQRRHQCLAHSGILIDRFLVDPKTHRRSSGYMALKEMLVDARRRRKPAHLGRHLVQLALDLPDTLRGVSRHLRGHNGAIYTRSEQAPNPDSRVTLGTERDRLGVPTTRLDWRLTPLDKRTIRIAVEVLGREFQRLGLGRVTPDAWLTEDDHSWPAWTRGGYHHMGTTRMSSGPQSGVVDPECRVFDLPNLYIAGASVFPTGGHANPTLTLVALALRLADHLKAELAKPEAVGVSPASRHKAAA